MDHTTPYGLTPKQHHLLIARIWPLQAIRFIIPVVNLIWTFLENLRPGHPQSNCCCWLTKSCLTLWLHELQHAKLPCLSLSPGVCFNSCPLSQWCHPTISPSVAPFSPCLQSFPASGSFPVSQLFPIRWPKYWSFSFSISSSNEYSGLIFFRIDWLDLLAVQDTLKSLL